MEGHIAHGSGAKSGTGCLEVQPSALASCQGGTAIWSGQGALAPAALTLSLVIF